MTYAEAVYDILKTEVGEADYMYDDSITHLVGVCGLRALVEENLIEPCGVARGSQLYTLVKKE